MKTPKEAFINSLEKSNAHWYDDDLAIELYASMCNTYWAHTTKDLLFSCSWRFAGGIVADLRDRGENYLDFYCSGNEGHVTPRISSILSKQGWRHSSMHDEIEKTPIKTPPKFKI